MATYNFDSTTLNTREGQRSLLQKSFFYMFLLLLLTAAVSLIVHYIFDATIGMNADAYNITIIVTAFVQLALTIIMPFTALKSGKGQIVCFILYAVCMGVFISTFAMVLNWWTIMAAFGISALAFGGMALIGAYSKKASAMGIVGMGLLSGVLLVSLFNVFMFIFLPGVWLIQSVVVSSIVVVAMLLVAAYDVYNIKRISATGENSSNLALHFAFNLYLDFILIFIHLIRIIAITTRR